MSEVRKIPLEEAVGLPLAHDLTEVNPEEKHKGRAFKRGQIIQAADLEKLRQLGKDEIYILDLGPDQIHEDEAALLMARAFAGRYIGYEPEPREGKINFYAQKDGLLLVDTAKLQAVNLLAKPSCITKPRHRPVRQGEMVAATRIIPLYCERQLITKAAAIAAPAGLFSLLPFKPAAAGVIVTGNEVYQGKVKDGFLPVITRKLAAYQAAVHRHAVLPDDLAAIRQAIGEFIAPATAVVRCRLPLLNAKKAHRHPNQSIREPSLSAGNPLGKLFGSPIAVHETPEPTDRTVEIQPPIVFRLKNAFLAYFENFI